MAIDERVEHWTDERIIEGLRNRDSAACHQMNRKYGKRILSYLVHKKQGDPDDAEEALARTMYKAVVRIQTYGDGHASMLPWLCTIAYNSYIDLRRERGDFKYSGLEVHIEDLRLDQKPLEQYPEALIWTDGSESKLVTVATSRDEIIAAVRDSIDELSPEDKRLIMGSLFEGSSNAELAQECSIAQGTLRTRLCRARERLVAQLKVHPLFAGLPVNSEWLKLYEGR